MNMQSTGEETQRSSLFRLIAEQPGLDLKELADALGFSRSTVAYHVRRLGPRVVTIRQGRHRLHFSSSMHSMQRQAIALLRIWSVRFLVEAAIREKVIDPHALAQEKGISGRSVRRSIRMLVDAGLAQDHPDEKIRGARRLDLHPHTRLAWSIWCRGAEGDHPLGPLHMSPGLLFLLPGWAFAVNEMFARLFPGGTAR